ncbi:hypothetical protein FRB94_004905 [Tulasnella sp. JGI-2019a]|nr:hypothetical protein FRB93_006553 [Tulasnella sp. JGI-2019a]KAG9001205.1 hypothetical protein FRB94_004905 [Tulasnella sp. JGI-2019a]KAG9029923.1 hypothetical protein FRB95_004719 [Tulasnella sp. JGI-2019a]
MEDGHGSQPSHKRTLHGKRSFKHGSNSLAVDSPLYDASEEDNDEMADDTSTLSHHHRQGPSSRSPLGPNSNARPSPGSNHAAGPPTHPNRALRPAGIAKVQGAAIQPIDSDAIDSPTYDGDIESSTATPNPATRPTHTPQGSNLSMTIHAEDVYPSNPTSTITSDSGVSTTSADDPSECKAPPSVLVPAPPVVGTLNPSIKVSVETPGAGEAHSTNLHHSIHHSLHHGHSKHALAAGEPAPAAISTEEIDPSALTPDEIKGFVQAAIDGTDAIPRNYKPNPPPKGRPVRVYADGVYDIFHFAHALQLRQAKLSFPSVHLIVGVCSDELCAQNKSRTVMSHAERCESVRHCRWVDEIVADAPWVIDQAFIDKNQIDYVAHDEDPYAGSDGSADVYWFAKSTGHFIPTRRTPGVSTSELLERIVAGYRDGDWDAKLVKIGHPELTSRAPSRVPSRAPSRAGTSSRPTSRQGHGSGFQSPLSPVDAEVHR